MFVLGLYFGAAILSLNAQEPSQFRSDIIAEYPLGHLDAGKYTLRASITTIAPAGKIPYHVHELGGFRVIGAKARAFSCYWEPKFAA